MAKSRSIKEAFAIATTHPTPSPHTTARRSLSKALSDKTVTPGTESNIDKDNSIDSADESGSSKPQRKPVEKVVDAFARNFERKMNALFKHTSEQLMAEIGELSQRVSEVEERLDDIENYCMEQRQASEEMKDALLALKLQTEDGENRSRRSNIRIRGIPENIHDAFATATAIFQELIPNIALDRLELDRAHRALSKPKPDGPPRDIVVKLHFFRTKEAIMHAAREKAKTESLTFQGKPFQLFADISPSTITRRREMKPNIAVLVANNIVYKWGFPFRIIFQYKTKWYTASTVAAFSDILTKLGLKIPTNTKRSREPTTPETSHYKKLSARGVSHPSQSDQTSESVEMG